MSESIVKPSQQKIVLDKYFRAFLRWALKLSIDDKIALARFMRSVQQAHKEGQEVEPEPEPEPEPKLILPGLGGGSFIAHQEAVPGATYGGLDDMLKNGRKPS